MLLGEQIPQRRKKAQWPRLQPGATLGCLLGAGHVEPAQRPSHSPGDSLLSARTISDPSLSHCTLRIGAGLSSSLRRDATTQGGMLPGSPRDRRPGREVCGPGPLGKPPLHPRMRKGMEKWEEA